MSYDLLSCDDAVSLHCLCEEITPETVPSDSLISLTATYSLPFLLNLINVRIKPNFI